MPVFGRNKEQGTEDFVQTIAAADVGEGGMIVVPLGKRKLILTRYGGQLYAIDSLCPHAAADLTKGSLRNWQICCHEHDYCFDIRSGRIVWPEDEVYRLRRYETKEEDGHIWVRMTHEH